ncbi:hypothetical protein [Actinokineospora sp. UTMC 2448]|uniref:hypothetical protein n=1 Tax=Actinokineospora sp. UTMC 2448 TaxID=2268449 RepID=UPI0021644DB4|nr:hypothetical protein [Actinokineospora sp. UTMC 2448]
MTPSDPLPNFLARSKQAQALNWDDVGRLKVDEGLRERFEARRAAGEVATSHLVRLAEPMVRRGVQRVLDSPHVAVVVDADDLLNAARLAVAQGVWAYEPTSAAGPWFLIQRIVEGVKRELLPANTGISIPHRAERRFRRIAAIRNHLHDSLGREPEDDEILTYAGGALTDADLALERRTRLTRMRPPMVELGLERAIGAPSLEVEHGRSGWREVVRVLRFDPVAVEVISRVAALPPYEDLGPEDRSERAVAETTGTTRAVVRAALRRVRRQARDDADQLRHFLRGLSDDDREGLGLQCFAQRLDRELV